MHLVVNVEIIFPAITRETESRKEIKIRSVNSFSVNSSWRNLTDTAEVVIAKKLYVEQKKKLFDLLKTGDTIIIRGGYGGQYNEEFRGFITYIEDDMPVRLICEDTMYRLKRVPVKLSKSNITLKQLLTEIVPKEYTIDAMDIGLGKVFFDKVTVAQVLNLLKDNFGIYSYFIGDTLVSGKIYSDNPQKDKVKYVLEGPGKNTIKNDLKHRKAEDRKLKIVMRHLKSDGSVTEVEIGDKEGQVNQLYCGESDKIKMRALAKKELDRLKFDGYEGGVTTFAIPFAKHGFTTVLVDKLNEQKSGSYYIDEVTTTLNDMGAYHRVIKLGPKAAQ